jgi:steroid delta-isomerase-like uncharacterized protein
MTAAERNLGRRWFEQVWNLGRREAIGEMLAADAVLHDGSVDTIGSDAFYRFFDRLTAALSEMHVDVADSIAQGDRICIRWTSTAVHSGEGLGVAPAGRAIRVTGITIFRIADERIAEAWQNWDMMGLMQQIKGLARAATYVG